MLHLSQRIILLVEDDALVAHQEAGTLAKVGYEVLIARSGVAAVDAALSNGAIDLILRDIDLGGGMDMTAAAPSPWGSY
jgi:DNA-binding response OmpR family regulator